MPHFSHIGKLFAVSVVSRSASQARQGRICEPKAQLCNGAKHGDFGNPGTPWTTHVFAHKGPFSRFSFLSVPIPSEQLRQKRPLDLKES